MKIEISPKDFVLSFWGFEKVETAHPSWVLDGHMKAVSC